MKNLIKTDFDKVYDELSECYTSNTVFNLLESYIKDLYYSIKQFDLNAWNNYNNRNIAIEDIHMLLPEEIKQEYCDNLNKIIQENNGCLSLIFYFNTDKNKVEKLVDENIYHDHHINLRELLPNEEKVVANQIVVTTDQHIYLHKILKEACQKYIKTGKPYDSKTFQICIGAYKKVLQNNYQQSATEISNTNNALKAGNINNARDFNFSQKALDKNKEIERNITGKIPDKGIYLFIGYPFTNTFVSDLSLDRCLNNGKPFETVTKAGNEINRNKGRISFSATHNHEIILANKFNIGLSTVQGRDIDNNNTGEVYIPIFVNDWELINKK